MSQTYPLSPLQEGMLFHDLLASSSRASYAQFTWILTGALDVEAYVEAWRVVVARHDALRTSFVVGPDPQPLQTVHSNIEVAVDVADLRASMAEAAEAAVDAYRRDDIARGFRLTEKPLTRVRLFRKTEEATQVVWSFHHAILDGWSMEIVRREVAAIYERLRRKEDLGLDDPPQFHAYIEWLQGQDQREAETYWRRMLEGFASPVTLGFEQALRNWPNEGWADSTACTLIPPDVGSGLTDAARRAGVTLNSFVEAVWALLLSRYSGREDVVFGRTTAGRSASIPRIDEIVGPFMNVVPVRVEVDPDVGLATWAARVQRETASTWPFEHTALARIQGWSQVPQGEPLFHSLVTLSNYPVAGRPEASATSDSVVAVDPDRRNFARSPYPLYLRVIPVEGALDVEVGYDSAVYAREDVERITRDVRALVEDVAADPARRLAELAAPVPAAPAGRATAPEPAAFPADEAPVEYVAPRTPVETELAAIWSEILGVEQVGAADDFFELGGDSLFAIRLLARVRSALEVDLFLRDIFDAATLSELSVCIEERKRTGAAAALDPATA